MPNPDDQFLDTVTPIDDGLLCTLVAAITGDEHVVTTGFSDMTRVLMNELLCRKLYDQASKLYQFKVQYISDNYTHSSIHNPIKLLQWDSLDGRVRRSRLGLPDGATDLAVLAKIAEALAIK